MESAPYHATCVAVDGIGVFITGAAGRGKSTLALRLMAFGARLVADDQCILRRDGDALIARCPVALQGLIEARGVGVLNADALASAPVQLVVDLDQSELDRIPLRREVTLLGCKIPLLHGADAIHLAPAILQWMRAGRSER